MEKKPIETLVTGDLIRYGNEYRVILADAQGSQTYLALRVYTPSVAEKDKQDPKLVTVVPQELKGNLGLPEDGFFCVRTVPTKIPFIDLSPSGQVTVRANWQSSDFFTRTLHQKRQTLNTQEPLDLEADGQEVDGVPVLPSRDRLPRRNVSARDPLRKASKGVAKRPDVTLEGAERLGLLDEVFMEVAQAVYPPSKPVPRLKAIFEGVRDDVPGNFIQEFLRLYHRNRLCAVLESDRAGMKVKQAQKEGYLPAGGHWPLSFEMYECQTLGDVVQGVLDGSVGNLSEDEMGEIQKFLQEKLAGDSLATAAGLRQKLTQAMNGFNDLVTKQLIDRDDSVFRDKGVDYMY